MLDGSTPEQFLRYLILVAVRDGSNRVVVRSTAKGGCGMVYRVAEQSYEMVPPSFDLFQQMPAALARMERKQKRWFSCIGSFIRRSRQGRFRHPIGAGSVLIAYRTRWEAGRLAELEISIDLAPHLASVATAMLTPPVSEGYEYIDD